MTTEQLKHLDFLESTIARMGSHQFQIKGWMITVDTALLTVFANSCNSGRPNKWFLLIGLFPTLAFWMLDAKFLSIERKIRSVYAAVASGSEEVEPFAIMSRKLKDGEHTKLRSCMFSSTNMLIYLTPTIGFLFGYLLLVVKG